MHTYREQPMLWTVSQVPTTVSDTPAAYSTQGLVVARQVAQGGVQQYHRWDGYTYPQPDKYFGTNNMTSVNAPHGMQNIASSVPFEKEAPGSVGPIEPVNMQYQQPYPFDLDSNQLLQQFEGVYPNGDLFALGQSNQMPDTQVAVGAELGVPVDNTIGSFLLPPNPGPGFLPENNGHARLSLSPSPPSLSVPSLQASSSATPAPSGLWSDSMIGSPKAENEADPPTTSTARRQAKTKKHRPDRREFGGACDRCSKRKISCRDTAEGPCVACTRYARRHPDHVCALNREIGKRGRPKGVKDGEGRTPRVAKGGKRAGRKTKGVVTPDELARKEEGVSEESSQSTGFDAQQHGL